MQFSTICLEILISLFHILISFQHLPSPNFCVMSILNSVQLLWSKNPVTSDYAEMTSHIHTIYGC